MIFGSSKFFTKVIHSNKELGLSSGYELGDFRDEALARLMFAALPEFALKYTELKGMDPANVVAKLSVAAKSVYQSQKYKSRGEFGELLLHLVMRDFFKTSPIVSKIFYKDSANITVKGFDAVHVTKGDEGDLYLWLGETKFYNNCTSAIRDVLAELNLHFEKDFLRNEFLFIQSKADQDNEILEKFKNLIAVENSLDKIFKKLFVPILLTYDSCVVKKHIVEDEQYLEEIESELRKNSDSFFSKKLPAEIEFILILVPLSDKSKLVKILDTKLRALQNL